jgi:hypothetical protein
MFGIKKNGASKQFRIRHNENLIQSLSVIVILNLWYAYPWDHAREVWEYANTI